MITCAIIDDEPPAIEILEHYVQRVPFLQQIARYDSSVEAMIALKTTPVDLIFLDIHMPELSGMQVSKMLNGKVNIIFTTAHSQYALEAFDHQVIDYLLKPISFERFLAAAQKAKQLLQLASPTPGLLTTPPTSNGRLEESIFVKVQSKVIKIYLSQILYLESLGNYVNIHTTNERLIIHSSIKELAERLPHERFMRVHKSYVIALERIKSVEGNQIFLEGLNSSSCIPLGAAYRSDFLCYLQKKMVN